MMMKCKWLASQHNSEPYNFSSDVMRVVIGIIIVTGRVAIRDLHKQLVNI